MPIWPSPPLADRLDALNLLSDPDAVARTDVDGPFQQARIIASPGEAPFGGPLTLHGSAELVTLRDFYRNTLRSGTDPFDWVHQVTGDAIVARFTAAPVIRSNGPVIFVATLSFVELIGVVGPT